MSETGNRGGTREPRGSEVPTKSTTVGSPDVPGWRPIETAPRNGKKIRAFCPDASWTYKTYVLRWSNPDKRGDCYEHFNDGAWFCWPATHWVPMSEPEPAEPPPGPYPDHDETDAAMTKLLATPYVGARAAQLLLALRGVDQRYRADIDAAAAKHGWHSEEHWGLVREVSVVANAVFNWFEKSGPETESYNWISAVQSVRYNKNPFRERDLVGIAGPAMS